MDRNKKGAPPAKRPIMIEPQLRAPSRAAPQRPPAARQAAGAAWDAAEQGSSKRPRLGEPVDNGPPADVSAHFNLLVLRV